MNICSIRGLFCKLLKQMIHCSMYTCIMCTWTFKNVGTFSSYKFRKASHIFKLIWTISTKNIYSNCWYIMMHNYFWQTSSYVLTHPFYIFCPFNLPESFKIWNIKVWQGSLSALSFLSCHLFLSHFLQFSCCKFKVFILFHLFQCLRDEGTLKEKPSR